LTWNPSINCQKGNHHFEYVFGSKKRKVYCVVCGLGETVCPYCCDKVQRVIYGRSQPLEGCRDTKHWERYTKGKDRRRSEEGWKDLTDELNIKAAADRWAEKNGWAKQVEIPLPGLRMKADRVYTKYGVSVAVEVKGVCEQAILLKGAMQAKAAGTKMGVPYLLLTSALNAEDLQQLVGIFPSELLVCTLPDFPQALRSLIELKGKTR
jgi:hypothetical protein